MATRIYTQGDNPFLSFYISNTDDFTELNKFIGRGESSERVVRTLDGRLEKVWIGNYVVHVPASPETPIEVTRESGTHLYLRSGFLVFLPDEFKKWFSYISIDGGKNLEPKR